MIRVDFLLGGEMGLFIGPSQARMLGEELGDAGVEFGEPATQPLGRIAHTGAAVLLVGPVEEREGGGLAVTTAADYLGHVESSCCPLGF